MIPLTFHLLAIFRESNVLFHSVKVIWTHSPLDGALSWFYMAESGAKWGLGFAFAQKCREVRLAIRAKLGCRHHRLFPRRTNSPLFLMSISLVSFVQSLPLFHKQLRKELLSILSRQILPSVHSMALNSLLTSFQSTLLKTTIQVIAGVTVPECKSSPDSPPPGLWGSPSPPRALLHLAGWHQLFPTLPTSSKVYSYPVPAMPDAACSYTMCAQATRETPGVGQSRYSQPLFPLPPPSLEVEKVETDSQVGMAMGHIYGQIWPMTTKQSQLEAGIWERFLFCPLGTKM